VIAADGSATRRIGHGEFGRILELAVAPDGRTAAIACADGRLLTVALDGEPVITEIARSTNAEVAGLAFAPDSALLAWSQPWRPERRGSHIRLARLADGTVIDVTPAPLRRHLAGVHPGRQAPGVPVEPRIRSGTRHAYP
jgi:tricorn protease